MNYSCPGESTYSFISGPCPWSEDGSELHDPFTGSQLDAAVRFLRAHRGKVSPITLTLWGNDVAELVESCGGDLECVQAEAPGAIQRLSGNLATILDRLRSAAPYAEIIVTGPWDSFVGSFPEADPLFMALNGSMANVAAEARARHADIFPIFNPQGDIAVETATFCTMTLICSTGDSHLRISDTRRSPTSSSTSPDTGGVARVWIGEWSRRLRTRRSRSAVDDGEQRRFALSPRLLSPEAVAQTKIRVLSARLRPS